MNNEGKILEINKRTEKLLGLKRDEILGENYLKNSKICEQYLPLLKKRFKKLMEGEILEPIDIQMFDNEDKPIWVSVFSSRIKIGNVDFIQAIIQDINKRRRMELELKEREQIYHSLINNIEEIAIEFDIHGLITDINSYVEHVLGYKPEELIKTNIFELVHPDDLERLKNTIKESNINGDAVSCEYLVKHKNGNYLPIYATGGVRKFDDTVKVIAVLKDFSKIKSSEAKYKHLYETFPYGIILLRHDGIIIDANSAIQEEFGYAKEDLIGHNFFTIPALTPEIVPLLKERFEKYKKGNNLNPITLQITKKDGNKAWINPYVSLITIGTDRYVQITTKDVSERVKAMNELKESEQLFRTIAEQSFMATLILQDDVLKYANKKIEDVTGYTQQEFLAWEPGFFLTLIHPEDRKLVEERAELRQKGELLDLNNYQIRIKKKSGEYIWIELFSTVISYNGKLASLVTFMDISKDKQVEDLLLNEIKNLRESRRFRKDFINRISHELKSPLTAINGATELLNELLKDKLNQEENEILKIIIRGSDRLKKLIGEILDISKLEEKESSILKKKENLSLIVEESINNIVHNIKERELSLTLNISPDVYVHVNKIRMEQVFNNLISNAIKNTPKGGRITIDLNVKDGFAMFSVKDTGVGIKKTDMNKLFKEFSRINRSRDDIITEGTGLGLYLSKQIVKMHGGEIFAESEGENKGATFRVKLPLD